MKSSILAVSVLSAVAAASALPEAHRPAGYGGAGEWKGNRGHGKGYGYGKGEKGFPIPFTSTYRIKATPDQVVDANNTATGGLAGCTGYYDFGINSELDTICYYIKLEGFRGEYQSPADTATHIHEAARGMAGPPRLAFPNPRPVAGKNYRVSAGCLTGPFETGVINSATGMDTGAGFKVKQIEDKPEGFFADVHSSLAVPGAVRGQLY